jgi:hypothetical protein
MGRKELQSQMYSIISGWYDGGKKKQDVYALEAGISLSCFKYWLRKYDRLNQAAMGGFLEIVSSKTQTLDKGSLYVLFPNGVQIALPVNSDISVLGKAVKCW